SRLFALSAVMLSGLTALSIPETMVKKTARPRPAKSSLRMDKTANRKTARVKGPRQRAKADTKAAHGALPHLTNAQIEEAFRRFKAANPQPQTELRHVNPYTLLVAVVLSAQATDAGVNKAT